LKKSGLPELADKTSKMNACMEETPLDRSWVLRRTFDFASFEMLP